MKRLFIITICILILMPAAVFGQQNTTTLKTHFPSPFGKYVGLNAEFIKMETHPDPGSLVCSVNLWSQNGGRVYFDGNDLKLCTAHGFIGLDDGTWESLGLGGRSVYPKRDSCSVKRGCPSRKYKGRDRDRFA